MTVQKEIMTVEGINVRIQSIRNEDYISLTDLAAYKSPRKSGITILNWMRTHRTISYMGLWEILNNPNFKVLNFEYFKNQSGNDSFSLTPSQWIRSTDAIGIVSRRGRYGGGTFAHIDIALKFASWISVEFELYLITEFKRLKQKEQMLFSHEWNLQRLLAKINYQIHTDAIAECLIPAEVSAEQAAVVYADEADLLNVALFGLTAMQWRAANPNADAGMNVRDTATLEQLIVLSNMESINALLIRQGLSQHDRLLHLNQAAITQMKSLQGDRRIRELAQGRLALQNTGELSMDETNSDPAETIRALQIKRANLSFSKLHSQSEEQGMDSLSMDEINKEIAACRAEKRSG